jgi:hypothetical protein
MAANESHNGLIAKLRTIKSLAEESEALLKARSPDVDKLLATLQVQAELQRALLEKLMAVMNPSQQEKDLSDTFQQAVQELMEYFRERVRLQGKVADAAALEHLRKE